MDQKNKRRLREWIQDFQQQIQSLHSHGPQLCGEILSYVLLFQVYDYVTSMHNSSKVDKTD